MLLMCGTSTIYAATIGSDTAVNRFSTQQTINNTDRVAGFAWLEGGFRLNDLTVTGTFDSVFPVSGSVDFNGGRLFLHTDLNFTALSSLILLGRLSAEGFSVDLSNSIHQIPQFSVGSSACLVNRIASATPNANTILSCDWSFDHRFIAVSTTVAILNTSIFIYEFTGSSLIQRASSNLGGGVVSAVNAIRWHPSKHLLAVARNDATLITSQMLTLTFNTTSFALSIQDTEAVVGESALSAAWHPTGNFLAFGTNSALGAGSVRIFDVDGSGNMSAPLVVSVSGVGQPVQFEALDWVITGSFFAVGMAAGASQELEVYSFTTGPKAAVLNASVELGVNDNTVAWHPTTTTLLAAGIAGTSGNLVRLYSHNPGAGSLTQIAGISDLGQSVEIIDWNNNGSCLGVGRDTDGVGGRFRTYEFDANANQFTRITDVTVGSDVEALSWSRNGQSVAIGSNTNLLTVYSSTDFLLSTTPCFDFENVRLLLGRDIALERGCLRFSGTSTIDGRGNSLSLGPTSTLVVNSNSSLLFKDITLRGIHDARFFCVDNTATMSFENATLLLDGNLTFSNGKFILIDDLTISGTGFTFKYTSDLVSTVMQNSSLIVDDSITFSYHPSSASRDRLQFVDNTARLVLNGATFHTTAAGIDLTKGVLWVDSESVLSNEGSTQASGIVFGDGSSTANNFDIMFSPAAVLVASKGFILYNNI